MANLYQKQNQGLSGIGVVMPDKKPSVGAAIANFGTAALEKVAKDNFALGHAALERDIIDSAYEMNPTDPAAFSKMVQENIAKQTKNLPGEMARAIRLNAEKQANAKLTNIKNNQIRAANAELETNVLALRDTLATNTAQLQDVLFESLINGDAEGTASVRAALDQNKRQLTELSNRRTSTGAYVIGKEAERAMMQSAQYGMEDAFRKAMGRMSKDELIKFYEGRFANQEDYIKATGIDYDTYDKQDKFIKGRIKEFDSEYKRVVKDQQFFRASQMKLNGMEEAEIDVMEKSGQWSPETIKALRKAYKELNKKGGDEYAGFSFGLSQNEGFLATMTDLQEVMTSVDDGSPEYADKLLQAGVRANLAIKQMQDAGLSQDSADILYQTVATAMSDQDFAEIFKIQDDSLLAEITRGAAVQMDNERNQYIEQVRTQYDSQIKQAETQYGENAPQIISQLEKQRDLAISRAEKIVPNTGLVRGKKPEIRTATMRNLPSMGAQIWLQALQYAMAGDYESARRIRNEGNKQLIRYKYQDFISPYDFERMENDIANKIPTSFTYNNSVYEFMGFSQNSVIVKGRF